MENSFHKKVQLTEIMANKVTTLKENKFIYFNIQKFTVVQGKLQPEKNGKVVIYWVKWGKAWTMTEKMY